MPRVTRAEIAELIPHAGAMCLLDAVVFWDADSIRCASNTHRDFNHPLRERGVLAPVHLIEYGAQAVAVHGGLLARGNRGPALDNGRLAGVRDVQYARTNLSRVQGALEITARRELAGATGLIYRFEVHGDHSRLARGRLTIAASTTADRAG